MKFDEASARTRLVDVKVAWWTMGERQFGRMPRRRTLNLSLKTKRLSRLGLPISRPAMSAAGWESRAGGTVGAATLSTR
jgi:hypothetical protein